MKKQNVTHFLLLPFISLLVACTTHVSAQNKPPKPPKATQQVEDGIIVGHIAFDDDEESPSPATTSENYSEEASDGIDISHRYQYKVRGKQYKVFNSSTNFQQIGIASWYGKDFHGKKTSSGEPYDMYAMTAAHKTLPLGSFVEVTNLDNGLKVIVRINDRGPFHKGRIIDLSKKAARKLGIAKKGYGRVHLKAL